MERGYLLLGFRKGGDDSILVPPPTALEEKTCILTITKTELCRHSKEVFKIQGDFSVFLPNMAWDSHWQKRLAEKMATGGGSMLCLAGQ